MVVARLIRALAGAVAAVIVIAIILTLLSANPHNVIVSDIHDAGQWLVGPFKNVFSVSGAKLHEALNWGLAAVVYLIVGNLLASLLARSTAGSRYSQARPVA
ncbi:MAG TPA: hypothetical protein VGF70_07500 [Solirubrobacteraceae bacterium]|jgi:CDP-diglyceride synthetase